MKKRKKRKTKKYAKVISFCKRFRKRQGIVHTVVQYNDKKSDDLAEENAILLTNSNGL